MFEFEIERIVLAHQEKIRRFFLKSAGAREDADDLSQEAISRVISSGHSFSSRSSPGTWVYAICRNVLYSYYHKKDRLKKLLDRLAFILPESGPPEPALTGIIEKLPARLRLMFDLFYVKRYKIHEISALLNKPAGTVKYALYELRSRVRDELTLKES